MESLGIGSKLARYRLVEKLGEGGMGIVYKARDEHLQRFVAIKVLKSAAKDPRRAQDLEREAGAASRLNHPNIITVYDFQFTSLEAFIVFEYVDGQPLAMIVPPDGLDPRTVFKYAAQIASALVAVSRVGLVHRDLKPANIMITSSGTVKVLDFGLAGLYENESQSALSTVLAVGMAIGSDDATLIQRRPGPGLGLIAGTPAYMAPEQSSGGKADVRTDIYALGAVIFRMATGRDFAAETKPEGREYALKQLTMPLRLIVRKCVEPDPGLRYQTATQLLGDLQEHAPQKPTWTSRAAARVTAGFLTIALLTLAGLTAFHRLQTTEGDPPNRPEPLTSYPGKQVGTSFSPDGRSFAFAWDGGAGTVLDIYTQPVTGAGARRLTNAARRSYNPAWSPDGKWIAFLREAGDSHAVLIVIPAEGGEERVITALTAAPYLDTTALDWSPDSKWMVYGDVDPSQKKGIWAAALATGEKHLLIAPGPADGYFTQPSISPDGQSIVFVEDYYSVTRLRRGALDPQLKLRGPTTRLNLRGFDSFNPAGPRWMADSHRVLFSSNGSAFDRALWYADLSSGMTDLKPAELANASEFSSHPAISRDGSIIAFTHRIQDLNVWRFPLAKQTHAAPVRLLSSTRQETNPQYSPDGTRIAFDSDRNGLPQVWISDADGNNSYPVTDFHSFFVATPRWMPDGQQLVFDESDGGRPAIYQVEARRGARPHRVTITDRSYVEPYSCEGGRAIYYVDNTNGRIEIWRSPVAGGEAHRVLSNVSDLLMCSADGHYLYYLTPEPGSLTSSLIRKALPDGPSQIIVRGVAPGGVAPGPDRIYLRIDNKSNATSEIISLDLAGNDRRLEVHLTGKATGLSISPDGKYALLAMLDQDVSTLVALRRSH